MLNHSKTKARPSFFQLVTNIEKIFVDNMTGIVPENKKNKQESLSLRNIKAVG